MTKEYIFTLEVEDEEVIWKCIVSDDKCVTYEGDEKCEEFTLTTQERKPHVLQLDTKAKVYDDVLPLQVENGMPFIKIEGNWVASDTTEEVYELVTIGEGEYVLYITEDENTFSVSFRM